MRRRRAEARALSADELVAAFEHLVADARYASPEVRRHAIHQGLAAHGYDVVQALRARRWLRHGRPSNYVWDDARLSSGPSVTDVEEWTAEDIGVSA